MISAVSIRVDGSPGIVVGLTHQELDNLRNGAMILRLMTAEFGPLEIMVLASDTEDGVMARIQEGAELVIDRRDG